MQAEQEPDCPVPLERWSIEVAPNQPNCMMYLASLAILPSLFGAPERRDCTVALLEVIDHSRTAGIPFASPADRGSQTVRVRALAWSQGAANAERPRYAELIRDVAPGTDAAEHLAARLRFYGATVDSAAVSAAVSAPGQCARSQLTRPTNGIALVVAAFPPAMYEGAAAALAEQGIATVVTSGGESNVRLVLNHLATLGWPLDRLVLVGHGAGGPVANLIAMSTSSVRGLVSLDGFEALDRRRHPGLTGDLNWRPGNLRAPVLHWRPTGHPDADTSHYAAAARVDFVQVTLGGVTGKPFMTAPEVALAPPALQSLTGPAGAAAQEGVTRGTVAFIQQVLRTGAGLDTAALRRVVTPAFSITQRPALAEPAIRTDGRLDEPLWTRARTLPDATTVSVRVADDCDYIYVAVSPTRATPFITELILDGQGDVTQSSGADDLLLHASASLCWAFGRAEVSATDCNKSEAWWGASRTSQAGDPPVGEYYVAKRSLGLERCESPARLRVGALAGGWNRTDLFPAAFDKSAPRTWARWLE
jgi:hypothetical protein